MRCVEYFRNGTEKIVWQSLIGKRRNRTVVISARMAEFQDMGYGLSP